MLPAAELLCVLGWVLEEGNDMCKGAAQDAMLTWSAFAWRCIKPNSTAALLVDMMTLTSLQPALHD